MGVNRLASDLDSCFYDSANCSAMLLFVHSVSLNTECWNRSTEIRKRKYFMRRYGKPKEGEKKEDYHGGGGENISERKI